MARQGIVVATHPGDNSVDLWMVADGSRLIGVQVQTSNGSTRSGTVDLPHVPDKADKWDVSKLTGQEMKAVVQMVDGQPTVSGFILPQINQMTMDDPQTRVDRHQSDVIKMIDGKGNIDLLHPSGLSIRIGDSPEHAAPAGKNTDKNLAVDRNTGTPAFIRITMAGGTGVLTIEPSGALSFVGKSTVDVIADGAVTVTTKSTATVNADGAATIKTPSATIDAPETTCTGNLMVKGTLSYMNGMVGKGGTMGAGARIQGSIDVDGSMTATGSIMDTGGNSNHHSH